MTNTIGLGIAFVMLSILSSLLIYFVTRTFLDDGKPDDASDLAGSILVRISGLHGLVLALVFASELVEYQQLNFESAAEVNAVTDIFYDIQRYEAPEAFAVQLAMRRYLEISSGAEWRNLGDFASLLPSAWQEWETAYDVILNLEPNTPREAALRDKMLTNIQAIAETRDLRESHAITSIGGFFWFAAITGAVFVAACFFAYPPRLKNLLLVSVFATYTGVIFFIIFAMSNPFSDPGALKPELFEKRLDRLIVGAQSHAEF